MSRGGSNRISKQKVSPEYEKKLGGHLNAVWERVLKHLGILKTYIVNNFLVEKEEDENYSFWNTELFADCYQELYELCSCHDCIYYEEKLYDMYRDHITVYLESLLPSVEEKGGEEMITYIIRLWKAFKDVYVKYCLKLMSYLDRYYVRNENKPGLRPVAHKRFRELIYDKVANKLNGMMLDRIKRDRVDGVIDFRPVLKNGVIMFRDMDISAYQDVFEVELLKDTQSYYKILSENWLEESSVVRYFTLAKERIIREESMLAALFPPDTQRKLRDVMLDELLVKRRDRLLNQEFRNLIRDEKYKDLNLVYTLMKKIPDGIAPLAKILHEYVLGVGKTIFDKHSNSVRSFDDHQKMVNLLIDQYCEELIDLKDRLIKLICSPFQQDPECVKAFTVAFKEFVNFSFKRDKSDVILQAPQIFAYYCDEKIRKNAEDLDGKLEKVIDFIQYFKEKDIFVSEYKKQLSTRLLCHNSQFIREEDERTYVSKIKYKYRGISDIYKLERMLTDKINSRETKNKFKVFLKEYNRNKLKELAKKKEEGEEGEKKSPPTSLIESIEVTVLTQGAWPIVLQETLTPPPQILNAQEIYKQWYTARHQSRLLHWSYENCSCQVQALFRRGKKTIDLSTYQTVILLLFNNNDNQAGVTGYNLREIQESTKLRRSRLLPCLISLTSKKYKILELNPPKGKEEEKDKKWKPPRQWWKNVDTLITVNPNFGHRKQKFRVPMPRVTERSTLMTQKNISKDRSLAIDAAIVRIMKARRKLSMNNIINETLKQIHIFKPSIKQIKKRVESLIDNGYVERSDEDHRIIIYKA